MAAQATDMSSSEEEIDDTYSFTECGSDFDYEWKAGCTKLGFYFCRSVVEFFTYSFSVLTLINIYITEDENN